MPNSDMTPRDEPAGLSGSRAEFAASLKRRIESVLGALSALEQQPDSAGRRDNFLRRVHALASSAKVLGFAAATEILCRAEQQIRTSHPETLADDILTARRCLEGMPGFVLRGPYSGAPPSSAPPMLSAPPLMAEPIAVIVWGSPDFVQTLQSLAASVTTLEVTTVADSTALRTACIAHGPDVLLLDANQGSITLLVDELAQAPETLDVPIIVANVPDDAAKDLLELGARLVLPTRATEQQLCRALLQARHLPVDRTPPPVAYGDVTLKDLAERLAQEIRQGLVDAATPNAQLETVSLGDGTPIRAALWSALAQIREHVIESTSGRIAFSSGPEGSVPLAPRAVGTTRRAAAAQVDRLDLTGRRILVADDDPAVAWFVAGTLRATGAVVTEAHDGSQALELAYLLWPELIVSDVMMPGLDGFALCHALKRDVLLRDVPIVLLSWKEDLLFRMRDLGVDADGYLRKEASASTIVRRVKELLLPRAALERRLSSNQETRGRLDGTTTRQLLELAATLERPVRIALRDATAIYDLRLRHGSLVSATRTRHDGTVDHASSVLGAMLGITAGRFSVVSDPEPCDPMFAGSLQEILRPSVLRARAAQRVLSGLTLGLIDRLTLEPDAFGTDLPLLPMSLRPIADELLRGTAPRQLLASGVASVQLLESLLSDVARRGAVRAIADSAGADLLEREVLLLSAMPPVAPPRPAPSPTSLFTFQLAAATPEPPAFTSTDGALAPPVPDASPAVELSSAADHPRSPDQDAATSELPSSAAVIEFGSASPDYAAPVAAAPAAPDRSEEPRLPTKTVPVIQSDQSNRQTNTAPFAATIEPAIAVPATVVPLSKPPPTDDVDWAMELSWDTPSPAESNSTASLDAPMSKPVTSGGGFMRPSLATLERTALQHTPDLANAVVQAVSEVTPQPVKYAVADPHTGRDPKPKSTTSGSMSGLGAPPADTLLGAPSTESRLGAPPADTQPGAPAADADRGKNVTETRTPGSIDPTAVATPDVARSASPDATRDAGPTAHDPPATTPVDQKVTAGQASMAAATGPAAPDGASAHAAHTATSVELAAPAAAEATSHASTSQLRVEPTSAAINDTGSALGRDPSPPQHSTLGESPAALPVIHHPPRPQLQVPSVDDRKAPPIERDSEDPVFPLVSTANVSIEAQPSIDIGASASQSAIEPAASADAAPPRPSSDSTPIRSEPSLNRDTLRSPSDDALVAAPASHATAPSAQPASHALREGPASGGQFEGIDSRPPAASEHPRNASAHPPSARAPSSVRSPVPPSPLPPGPRPVGWIQALGLAALAGIVTFALTVPIASWVRKRQEPPNIEPPVALETTAPNLDPATSKDGTSASEGPLGSTATTNSTAPAPSAEASSVAEGPQSIPSATIEDLPLAPDQSLQPGQALIEVKTGGGHAIFIDDAFVGRGPVRLVTVQSGRHIVRTRLNGVERTDAVDVTAGRTLRISLEQTWK